MSKRAILVTGGAGYIGSHVVRQLGEAGERIVVLDNLGKGFRQAVTAGELVVGEVGDYGLVSRLLAEHQVDTVMHFAAHTIVPESVALPLKYYGNNTCSTRSLLQACIEKSVQHFVFSSTAAVYGIPEGGYASERLPDAAHQCLRHLEAHERVDAARCGRRQSTALCGAALLQRGPDPTPAAVSARPRRALLCSPKWRAKPWWASAPTFPCSAPITRRRMGPVWDYLHVEDLASAHLRALDYLRAAGRSVTLNVGYGHGHSVREVLAMVEKLGGKPLPIREEPRRAGDPAYLVSRAERIRAELGWQPHYDDLEAIVASSLAWERKLLREPWG